MLLTGQDAHVVGPTVRQLHAVGAVEVLGHSPWQDGWAMLLKVR
jgi:hypothetical protein